MFEVQSLNRILLQHPHDRTGKVFANIAQPAGDAWRRSAQAGPSIGRGVAFALSLTVVIERAKGFIQAGVLTIQAQVETIRRPAAQDQSPAPLALLFGYVVLIGHDFCTCNPKICITTGNAAIPAA